MWLALLALSAAASEPTWQQLHSPYAESSSYLQSNWNKYTENYHPTYILDGNPKTAWVEGAQGEGVGQWVEWPVSRVPAAKQVKLRIRNGYHKSKSLLVANAAPSAVRIELQSGSRVVYSERVELARDLTWQEVVLDPPSDVPVDHIRLVVLDAHKGSAYADLCISDIETYVQADVDYNGPMERAKQQAALGWIKARVDAAAYFAKQPKQYPFVATQWRREAEEVTADVAYEWAQLDFERKRQLDEALERPGRVRVDVKSTARLPEGLDPLQDVARWLVPGRSYFETDQEWRFKRAGDEHWAKELAESNVSLVPANEQGIAKRAAFVTRRVVEERGVYITTKRWLVSLDAQDRAVELFTDTVSNGDEMCSEYRVRSRYTVSYDGERVARIEGTRRHWCSGEWAEAEYHPESPSFQRLAWVPAS